MAGRTEMGCACEWCGSAQLPSHESLSVYFYGACCLDWCWRYHHWFAQLQESATEYRKFWVVFSSCATLWVLYARNDAYRRPRKCDPCLRTVGNHNQCAERISMLISQCTLMPLQMVPSHWQCSVSARIFMPLAGANTFYMWQPRRSLWLDRCAWHRLNSLHGHVLRSSWCSSALNKGPFRKLRDSSVTMTVVERCASLMLLMCFVGPSARLHRGIISQKTVVEQVANRTQHCGADACTAQPAPMSPTATTRPRPRRVWCCAICWMLLDVALSTNMCLFAVCVCLFYVCVYVSVKRCYTYSAPLYFR